MVDNEVLPYDFNKIIHYDNINISTSNFTGYTVNTKNKNIKLNISNLDNINRNSKKEEFFDVLKKAKRAGEKVNKLESSINLLKSTTQDIKNSLNDSVHNANDKPIVAGAGQNSGVDYRGIYSHELGNPDKCIRITNGMLGYSRNGDKEFQPILTPNGLVPDAITQIINISKTSSNVIPNTNNNDNGTNSSSGGNSSTTTKIIGSDINLLELSSVNIYDSEGKRVVEVDYIKNDVVLYKELLGRNNNGRIMQLILCDKNGDIIRTIQYTRNEKDKVVRTDIQYF